MKPKSVRHESAAGYSLKLSTLATHEKSPQERHQALPAMPAFLQRKGSQIDQRTSGAWEQLYHLRATRKPKNGRHESAARGSWLFNILTAMKVRRHRNGIRYRQLYLHFDRGGTII